MVGMGLLSMDIDGAVNKRHKCAMARKYRERAGGKSFLPEQREIQTGWFDSYCQIQAMAPAATRQPSTFHVHELKRDVQLEPL